MRILRKLTLKYLKMNRTRTIVTIIGIVLSVALITVITGLSTSAWQSVVSTQIRMNGDYDFRLDGEFDTSDIEKLQANRSVRDVYALQMLGIAQNNMANTAQSPFIQLIYTEEKSLTACATRVAEGRFPQNENELLIAPGLVNGKEKTWKVGDTVTLSLGKRYFVGENASQQGIEGDEVFQGMPYWKENEEFRVEETKTYTIVGILENDGAFLDPYAYHDDYQCVYTSGSFTTVPTLFVRLTDEAEKNYIEVMAQILGVDAEYLKNGISGNLREAEAEELYGDLSKNSPHVTNFEINRSLLSIKGYYSYDGRNDFMVALLIIGFVLLVVMAASSFIIRNSFAISLTEKTKLYGMLASVGTTPRQISVSVFFEGAVLGLFGIPIGILLGIGGTAAMLGVVNTLLKDMLSGMELIFWMPWFTYVLAAVLGAVTIFFSALNSAKMASRITPMEAIRNNREIKVSKRQQKKGYKTPKLIKKLFGIGGSIAWKNMKRSRRQYRTTVISIVVSVAIYMTAASFVNYTMAEMQAQPFFRISEYNMQLYLTDTTYTDDEEFAAIPEAEFEQQLQMLYTAGKLNRKRLTNALEGYFQCTLKEEDFSDDIRRNMDYLNYFKTDDGYNIEVRYMVVDDDTFEELCRMNGKSVEECKDKGFISSKVKIHAGSYAVTGVELELLKNPAGKKLSGIYHNTVDQEIEGQFDEEGYPMYEFVTVEHNADVELIGTYPSNFVVAFDDSLGESARILVSKDWFKNHKNNGLWDKPNSWNDMNLLVDAENPQQYFEELIEMQDQGKVPILSGVINYAKRVQDLRSTMLVVEIFIYGFIIVIALIGVTNIFNTITTNMKLRQKEFAILRSVGTTKREFNRMIHLECMLYTMKSLLIGIPLGLLGSSAVYALTNLGRPEEYRTDFLFPWFEILLCLVIVLFLLLIIMRFSIAKVSKQNIIETIRNDNI